MERCGQACRSWMRTPISTTVAALPRNETLKRGVNSLAIPDRMHRYQNVLSLLPGDQVEGLFQEGLLSPEVGDTILNCWEDMGELMSGTDELGGLQFLESALHTSGRTAHVRR